MREESGLKILVIGRSGQLAQALRSVGPGQVECFGRPDVDLAAPDQWEKLFDRAAPDFVLNAAAYTNVDKAESESDLAFAVNRDGPEMLAHLCDGRNIPLLHVSTDCVFDGQLDRAYEPSDPTGPLGVYGASKLAGEDAVSATLSRHLIVRVSWVFSEFGDNFVRTMLKLARSRESISVVNDQVGYPTYAPWLAEALLKMGRDSLATNSKWGTYHLSNEAAINRCDMARAIFEESARCGGPVAEVIGVPTAEYKTPAQRPLNARLSSRLADEQFGISQMDWRVGLRRSVESIVREDELS